MNVLTRVPIRVLIGALSCALALPAFAQSYPSKPIRMIVGIAPGGGLDTGARQIAAEVSQLLGQQLVVENRPGAGTTIASAAVAAAAPDGYTLQYAETSLLIAPSLYKSLPFDPVKSFTPICGVGWETLAVVVNAAVPARTTAELIALLKANPGKYSYGSPGVGTAHHLAMEMFKTQAGVDLVHIPYKGASQYMPDLASGVLPVAVASVTSTLPLVKAGKLRAVALTRPVRLALVPDWPTLAETLPGFDAAPSFFILAPAGAPADVVARLSDAFRKAVSTDELKRAFAERGATAEFVPSDVLAASIEADVRKWGAVARGAGAKAE
jgi:tripartite-type tricarboxylate transporter receptor subunit TctC